MKVTQSCPTLYDPMEYTVHGILQARILEWIALSLLQGIFPTQVSCIAGGFFTSWATKETRTSKIVRNCWWKVKMKVIESCPTLCNPMDYTIHVILQTRILEWVAVPFSRGSSQSRDWTQVSCIAGRFFTSWATREAQKLVVAFLFLILMKNLEII